MTYDEACGAVCSLRSCRLVNSTMPALAEMAKTARGAQLNKIAQGRARLNGMIASIERRESSETIYANIRDLFPEEEVLDSNLNPHDVDEALRVLGRLWTKRSDLVPEMSYEVSWGFASQMKDADKILDYIDTVNERLDYTEEPLDTVVLHEG